MLPYSKQIIDEDDIDSVVNVLKSDWLTTGPRVSEFEEIFAKTVGTKESVVVCNGTAALHVMTSAIGLKPGDEVLVPAITFASTANSVVFESAIPVFVDVLYDNLLIAPDEIERKITNKTKAILAVDYAGHPCEYEVINEIAKKNRLTILSDACHSLGGSYKNNKVGSLAKASAFSLHAVKPITTGEGGVISTDDSDLADKMRIFRNHGITSDHRNRQKTNTWFYEMKSLGYNYRITDFQCALGISQIKKLKIWIKRRQEIAIYYDNEFNSMDGVTPLSLKTDVSHAYHLYVVKMDIDQLKVNRDTVFKALRAEGIGVNLHYIPVYLHKFYQDKFNYRQGLCPIAEHAYDRIISLPIFSNMSDKDATDVVVAVSKVLNWYKR